MAFVKIVSFMSAALNSYDTLILLVSHADSSGSLAGFLTGLAGLSKEIH